MGLVPLVAADGDARPATQSEKNFHLSISNTFSKAIPTRPQGWDQTNDTTPIQELERVSVGAEKYPLKVYYCVAWQNSNAINEATEKLELELMKLAQKPSVSDQEITALEKRMAPHDVRAKIVIHANVLSEGIYETISPAPSIAGGLVFRSSGIHTPNMGWQEGATYIFFGKGWKKNGNYVETTAVKGLSHTTVQTILVKVQADPKRAQQIIQQINWDALKKLN